VSPGSSFVAWPFGPQCVMPGTTQLLVSQAPLSQEFFLSLCLFWPWPSVRAALCTKAGASGAHGVPGVAVVAAVAAVGPAEGVGGLVDS
jgi:hypothetical protein